MPYHRSEPPGVSGAPYALPPGTPALQADPRRARRRSAILSGCAVVAFGLGFVLGRADRARVPFQLPSAAGTDVARIERDWARSIARGPWDSLLADGERYLAVLERSRVDRDPELWHGARRLAEAALLDDSPSGLRLAARVAETLRSPAAPRELTRWIAPLEEHAR